MLNPLSDLADAIAGSMVPMLRLAQPELIGERKASLYYMRLKTDV